MAIYTTSIARQRQKNQILPALGLVAVIVAVEYLARHFVLLWLPTLGSPTVNDMLVTGIFYVGLVWLTVAPEHRNLAALGRTLRGILANLGRWQVWLAALATVLVTSLLVLADQRLWGSVRLPSVLSPWRSDTALLESAVPVLVPASLLLFNGVIVPFAEEWLWRGLVQPRMVGALGLVVGVLVTSALFSLKHAIIDASLGRLLAITGFGIVLGALAARRGWRAAALAHALANSTFTLLIVTGVVAQP